jgi:hypothetical protein
LPKLELIYLSKNPIKTLPEIRSENIVCVELGEGEGFYSGVVEFLQKRERFNPQKVISLIESNADISRIKEIPFSYIQPHLDYIMKKIHLIQNESKRQFLKWVYLKNSVKIEDELNNIEDTSPPQTMSFEESIEEDDSEMRILL